MSDREERLVLGGLSCVLILSVVGIIALFGLVAWALIEEEKQWQEFAKEHECRVVERERGTTSTVVAPVVGANGQVAVGVGSAHAPAKTGWLCDDGVTYWR